MEPVLTSSDKAENSSQCIQSVQIYSGYDVWLYVYSLFLTCLKLYVTKVSLCSVPVSIFIWLILCNPLTIQVCWYVGVCMCSNYQSHRLVPGDWLCVCYRKHLSHVGVAVICVALCTYWLSSLGNNGTV